MLEARDRVGGRVEQVPAADGGRPIQMGGELIGPIHTAYLELVSELGLSLQETYTAMAGDTTYDLVEGVFRSEDFPFADDAERADYERVTGLFVDLARTVDPADPWSHPDATRLDDASICHWARSVDALPSTVRALQLGSLSLAAGSAERTSLLSELRKAAVAPDPGFDAYYEYWESLQVTEGSAEVALRMAAELGQRIRLGQDVRVVEVSSGWVRRDDGDGRTDRGRGGRLCDPGLRPPPHPHRGRRTRAGSPPFVASVTRRPRSS